MAAKEEQLAALEAALAEHRHVVRGLFAPQEEGEEFAFTTALRGEVELAFERGMVRGLTSCVDVCQQGLVGGGIDRPVFPFLYFLPFTNTRNMHHTMQELQGEREQALGDLGDLIDVRVTLISIAYLCC